MLGTLVLAGVLAITSTDQTVQVSKGTKLDVNNFAGDVIVKAWDRDAVRVEVTHSDRESVDIKQGDQGVTIRWRPARRAAGRGARSTTRSRCRRGWRSASAATTPP